MRVTSDAAVLKVKAALLVRRSPLVPLSVVKLTVGVLGANVSPAIATELLTMLLTPPTVNAPAAMLIAPLMALVEAVGVNVAV